MCFGCYEGYLEEIGEPIINRRIFEAVDPIRRADPGGPMHCVVEDWNLDDWNVTFALDEAQKRAHPDFSLARMLADMTLQERVSAMAFADEFIILQERAA